MSGEISSVVPVWDAVEACLLADPDVLNLVGESGVSAFVDRPQDALPDRVSGHRAGRPMWVTYGEVVDEGDGITFGTPGNDMEDTLHFWHRHGAGEALSNRGVGTLYAACKRALCKRGALQVEGMTTYRVELGISSTQLEPATRVAHITARLRVVVKAVA